MHRSRSSRAGRNAARPPVMPCQVRGCRYLAAIVGRGMGRMVESRHPEDPKVKLINLYYLCPMSSKRNTQKAQSQHPEGPHIITINLDEWTTQTQKARTYLKADSTQGVSIEYINKLISKGKLRAWNIPELGIKLVEK
jgi:hypothetical protein